MNSEFIDQLPAVVYLVCREEGGRYLVVGEETDPEEADQQRERLETLIPDGRFRVYSSRRTFLEVSRTVKAGDARWHVVKFSADSYGGKTREAWDVLPVSKSTVPSYATGMTEAAAIALCDLRNHVPEGYSVHPKEMRGAARDDRQPGFEVSTTENGKEWSTARLAEHVGFLLRNVEEHAAGAEQRAREAAEAAEAARLKKEQEEAAAAWVRKHGPRLTGSQQDFILSLRERLAELGGAETVEGPTDKAGTYQLTKVQASVYIDTLKKAVDELEQQQARAMFTVKESTTP